MRIDASHGGDVRVCLAAEIFYPVYSGAAVRFHRYLPGLRARGIEIEVFSGTPTGVKASMSGMNETWLEHRVGELLPKMEADGVPLHRIRLPDTGRLRRSHRFGRGLARFCATTSGSWQPEVVHLLSLGPGTVPALRSLRRGRIPIAYTLTMAPELSSNPIKRALQDSYVVHPLQLVDRIVVSSTVMHESLVDLGVETSVQVIPHGVDTSRFRPPSDPAEKVRLRDELGIPNSAAVALFLGPVSPRKGVDLLVESWSRLAPRHQDLHLVVVGPRRDAVDEQHTAFHAKIEGLIAASGAADRVRFTGLVENVEDYLRASDVFVFPSRREGMPNVFAEAMSSGLPLISTPFLGLPKEFGTPGAHYMLVDRNVDSIAQALEKMITEPGWAAGLGSRARSWVLEQLSVEQSLDAYAGLYRELASDAGAHA